MKRSTLHFLQATFCIVPLLAAMYTATAAQTDLASAPLETSSPTLVNPNLFFVLDDSGSMTWDYLPDTAGQDTNYRNNAGLVRNSVYNKIYYNPNTTYAPPVKYDGGTYPSMTSDKWTAVPYDGYGVQSANTGFSGNQANLFTTSNSGPTQNLVGNALYYKFVSGEYCTDQSLRNCAPQSAPSPSNPVAATLRWCSDTALTDCQATRIDTAPTGGQAYVYARYPGQKLVDASSATAKLSLTGSGNSSVSGITVGSVQIMAAGTGTISSRTTLAQAIVDAINQCTTGSTGNCTASGFSASRSSSTVTIVAPSSMGNFTDTPVVNRTGAISISAAAFSGGVTAANVPGQNVLTTISVNTPNYPQTGTRTDCVDTTKCTYTEEMTNFANWWAYYRTRMQMTKTAAGLGFSGLTSRYRLGYMSLNNNTNSDFLNVADITTGVGGQKDLWYQKLTAAKPSNGTGLRVALSNAGRMYAGKLTGSQQLWINASSGNTTKVNVTDPMQYACQRNYTLLSTDGYWNEDTTNTDNKGNKYNTITQVDGTTTIGDQDSSSGVQRPYYDGSKTSNTLADVAQYYYTTDIRSSILGTDKNSSGVDVGSNDTLAGQQRMYTYTIGLGVSGYMQYQPDYQTATSGDYYDVLKGTTASDTKCRWQSGGACNWPTPVSNSQTTVDDLWHAAVNGRGTYYSAGDPVAVKDGITNFLNNVDAQNSAGAAVSPSTANVTSSDNFLFDAGFTSVQWFGEIARYSIDPITGVPGTVPAWSQSGTANSSSPTPPTPLLDKMDYSTRKIYTNNGTTLINFAWDSLTDTMKNYFKMSAIGSLSQKCAAGTGCVPVAQQIDSTAAGPDKGMGGVNLVNFLRGDRSNEGNGGGKYYFSRTHVLGDIVGSQSAYVKKSNFNYTDTGYAAFKKTNETRQGMLYVGANDGMLHAFNADTGAESWAYIPSVLLPKLYKLADKSYSINHTYFVNGSPQQGEAYFDGAWHTMLVGGLAAGGRGYYALDVTTPDTPKVLWEFTSANDNDLGYTYGIPIITKLNDGTWAVIVTSGYNNISPGDGGGHLWVLNAKTGAIIKKIDTGVGSATAAVAGSGCTVAPCPSGLSRISAWMDNINLNNTVTQVYSGDLYGNVWRFDLTTLKADGSGTPTVQLLATLQDGSNNAQPITSWIELGYASGSHIIYVGTGSYLGVADIDAKSAGSTQVQTIYAIKDPLTGKSATTSLYGSPRSTACSATLKNKCFMRQTFTDKDGVRTVASSMSYATNLSNMNGWFIDLPNSGERINTDSTLQLGVLVFVSNIPNSKNACGVGGSGYLNYVDYKTGLSLFPATKAQVVGVLLAGGNGMGAAPSVYARKGSLLTGSVKLSTGKLENIELPPGAGGPGTRRVSWRELVTQ
ncbi:pilus assembly protein [Variovorax sp. EL159]|uniref:pilus assembly protein n=1 Tax=Variovorax sp. EL159 TaxID=1566270 RepID=UPI00087FA17A|nr:PilC/PilY family type IV pilus protein [Variovorax sp. EL159]SCX71230.1 type IV pilus assembly protein PilY1 [Variovorax sp. EL159]